MSIKDEVEKSGEPIAWLKLTWYPEGLDTQAHNMTMPQAIREMLGLCQRIYNDPDGTGPDTQHEVYDECPHDHEGGHHG